MTEPMPDPPVEYGGCPWPIDTACIAAEWEAYDPAIRERALALASSTLSRLTAYRVGNCPITVRPSAPRCSPAFVPGDMGGWINPGINMAGNWVNGCGCSGDCGHTSASEIDLPAPVGRVDQIKIDGVVMSLSAFALHSGHILVRTDGGVFPLSQDMTLDDDQPGTFSITYLNAYPVDMAGAQAAAYLALEFAKACKGKGKCSLPRNVTDVVRNGVSFTIQAGLFPGGRTSIEVVDAFIELWNPEARTQPTKVWTPNQRGLRSVRSLSTGVPLPVTHILDGGEV